MLLDASPIRAGQSPGNNNPAVLAYDATGLRSTMSATWAELDKAVLKNALPNHLPGILEQCTLLVIIDILLINYSFTITQPPSGRSTKPILMRNVKERAFPMSPAENTNFKSRTITTHFDGRELRKRRLLLILKSVTFSISQSTFMMNMLEMGLICDEPVVISRVNDGKPLYSLNFQSVLYHNCNLWRNQFWRFGNELNRINETSRPEIQIMKYEVGTDEF